SSAIFCHLRNGTVAKQPRPSILDLPTAMPGASGAVCARLPPVVFVFPRGVCRLPDFIASDLPSFKLSLELRELLAQLRQLLSQRRHFALKLRQPVSTGA